VKARKEKKEQATVIGLLGVGLDGDDGHRRITEAEDVVLVGSSAETHERMQETVIKLGEALEQRGKRIRDTSPEELVDLIRDARPQP